MSKRKPQLTQYLHDFAMRYITRRAKVVYGLIKAAGWKELEQDDYEIPLAELDGWGLITISPSKRRGYFVARARNIVRPRARRTT